MFAYCNNNPIGFEDSNGYFWKYAIGAVVNIATTYIATVATGGKYTVMDALVNGAAGALSAGGVVLNALNMGLTGVYNACSVLKNGGTISEAVICGFIAAGCAATNFGGKLTVPDNVVGELTRGATNLVFNTGANALSAAANASATDAYKPPKQNNTVEIDPSVFTTYDEQAYIDHWKDVYANPENYSYNHL